MRSREDFSCFAEGVLARGWSAALPGYTLAPAATLTQIVGELRRALDWLAAQGGAQGITGPVIISGWSAGGHLAALLLDHPSVRAGLAISGVYELGPIRDTYLNERLKLTEDEVATLSPLRLLGVNKALAITYGTADSDEVARAFRDDVARDYEMMSPGSAPRWHVYFWHWAGVGQACPTGFSRVHIRGVERRRSDRRGRARRSLVAPRR